MRKLITILIVTLAAISCGKIKDAQNTLNDIDTFINERPDSALTILDSFDTSLLDNKSVWAHHSLLHSQAKDKCYIDETNDSLMTQIVNYYEGKRDKEKLFKAYYYLGRIQYNAGDYAESMLSYTKAEQMITKIEDDFIKGLLYAQIGMLHQKYYDFTKSLEAYKIAYEYYTLGDKIAHQYFAKLNIGLLYQELGDYKTAERVLSEVMSWAYDNAYYQLCQEALELLLTLYDEIYEVEKSMAIIDSKYGHVCTSSLPIIQTRAYALAKKNDSSSIELLHSTETFIESLADTLSNHYYEYKILKLLGRYEEALEVHERMFDLQDTKAFSVLQKPLLSTRNSYLQAENNIMHLQVKMHKVQKYGIIILLCIPLLCLAFYYKRKIQEKQIKIIGYIELASDLKESLIKKCQEIENMSANLGMISSELQTCEGYVSEMFYKQYELLNKLTNTYYETHVCNKDMQAIYKQVSLEIEKLSSNKRSIRELENFVNRYKGNIMDIIRTQLPNLTDMEYRLLCYFCAGFSAKAISTFTGDSTNNIYVKKSRIKDTILRLPDKNIQQIILDAITIK